MERIMADIIQEIKDLFAKTPQAELTIDSLSDELGLPRGSIEEACNKLVSERVLEVISEYDRLDYFILRDRPPETLNEKIVDLEFTIKHAQETLDWLKKRKAQENS
jgi:DNA-binding transcriptional regulator GbsR (MarR family)